jgi:hypothetical protein
MFFKIYRNLQNSRTARIHINMMCVFISLYSSKVLDKLLTKVSRDRLEMREFTMKKKKFTSKNKFVDINIKQVKLCSLYFRG